MIAPLRLPGMRFFMTWLPAISCPAFPGFPEIKNAPFRSIAEREGGFSFKKSPQKPLYAGLSKNSSGGSYADGDIRARRFMGNNC